MDWHVLVISFCACRRVVVGLEGVIVVNEFDGWKRF